MRKWILFIAMAVILVFPSFASAQGGTSIESVTISLWPEYDKPDMLVINYIMLSEKTTLPVLLNVRVAADAILHTVAIGETSGSVSDQGVEYSTKKDGDWLVISVTATGSAIQIEYYDPSLKKDAALRSYSHRWLSDYDVENFGVVFQQPFDAATFVSSLSLEDDGIHADDMQYYSSNIGVVPAGETITFDMSYQKQTDSLSVSRLEVQPLVVDEDTPGRVSLNNYLPYMIGGLGVIMIVGGLLYYRQSGRSGSKKSRRRRTEGQENETGVYCAQCGTRARGGDRFCRTCGSRIRQSEE